MQITDLPFSDSLDWVGVKDPWVGVRVDLVALQSIVCSVLRIPATQCGPAIAIGLQHQRRYAHVYSFKLPFQTVVAHLVAPVKPLFKTEGEVAAMDFVRSYTTLPVPKAFAYCSEARNPVGVEWLIMEYMPGVELSGAWHGMTFLQKRRLTLDLVDLVDQLSRLKADGIGSIYHNATSGSDCDLLGRSSSYDSPKINYSRSPRWVPLSPESSRLLRTLCNHHIKDGYALGPLNDLRLLDHELVVPSPTQTMPIFTSEEYVQLIAFNGNPTTRSDYDFPTREKCVELFHAIFNLYPDSTAFGPSADTFNFCFSHGDLHGGNIFIDPKSGAITGIIDWEAAAFRPLWEVAGGIGWFEEDKQRFIYGSYDPINFAEDSPEDAVLRAFFRTELNRRNPDLFSCFLGGVELRAVVAAAADLPRPAGETDIFLRQYYYLGYWNEGLRGPFPWDMHAWMHRRLDIDEEEMARTSALTREKSSGAGGESVELIV